MIIMGAHRLTQGAVLVKSRPANNQINEPGISNLNRFGHKVQSLRLVQHAKVTSSRNVSSSNAALAIYAAHGPSTIFVRTASTVTSGPSIILSRSRGSASAQIPLSVAENDVIGSVRMSSVTAETDTVALIESSIDDIRVRSDNSLGGKITFYTSQANTTSRSARFALGSNNNIELETRTHFYPCAFDLGQSSGRVETESGGGGFNVRLGLQEDTSRWFL